LVPLKLKAMLLAALSVVEGATILMTSPGTKDSATPLVEVVTAPVEATVIVPTVEPFLRIVRTKSATGGPSTLDQKAPVRFVGKPNADATICRNRTSLVVAGALKKNPKL
jgi:hypothetical protein